MKRLIIIISIIVLYCFPCHAQDWQQFHNDFNELMANNDIIDRTEILNKLEAFVNSLDHGTDGYYYAEMWMSQAYFACGRADKGLPLAHRLLNYFKNKKDIQACVSQCDILSLYYEEENTDSLRYYRRESLDYLLPLIKREPKDPNQWDNYASYILSASNAYFELGDTDNAEKYALKAAKEIKNIPNNVSPYMEVYRENSIVCLLQAYSSKAERFAKEKKYKKAEKYYLKALETEKYSISAWPYLTDCLIHLVDSYARNNQISRIERMIEMSCKSYESSWDGTVEKNHIFPYYISRSEEESYHDGARALSKIGFDMLSDKSSWSLYHTLASWCGYYAYMEGDISTAIDYEIQAIETYKYKEPADTLKPAFENIAKLLVYSTQYYRDLVSDGDNDSMSTRYIPIVDYPTTDYVFNQWEWFIQTGNELIGEETIKDELSNWFPADYSDLEFPLMTEDEYLLRHSYAEAYHGNYNKSLEELHALIEKKCLDRERELVRITELCDLLCYNLSYIEANDYIEAALLFYRDNEKMQEAIQNIKNYQSVWDIAEVGDAFDKYTAGDTKTAINKLNKVIHVKDKLNQRDTSYVQAFLYLGIVQNSLGEYQNAINSLEKTDSLSRILFPSYYKLRGMTLSNLAMAYDGADMQEKRYDTRLLQKTILLENKEYFPVFSDGPHWLWENEMADICMELGDIKVADRDYLTALEYYKEGNALISDFINKDDSTQSSQAYLIRTHLIDCILSIVAARLENKQYEDAISSFQEAIAVVKAHRGTGLMLEIDNSPIYSDIIKLINSKNREQSKAMVDSCIEYMFDDIEYGYNHDTDHIKEMSLEKYKASAYSKASSRFESIGDNVYSVNYMERYVEYCEENGIQDDFYENAIGYLSTAYQRLSNDYLSATQTEYKLFKRLIYNYGNEHENVFNQFSRMYSANVYTYGAVDLKRHTKDAELLLNEDAMGMALECVREWRKICEEISMEYGFEYLHKLAAFHSRKIHSSNSTSNEITLLGQTYIRETSIYLYFNEYDKVVESISNALNYFKENEQQNKYRAIRELVDDVREYKLQALARELLSCGVDLALAEDNQLEAETFFADLAQWGYLNGDLEMAWNLACINKDDSFIAFYDVNNYAQNNSTLSRISYSLGNYEEAILYGKRALAVMENRIPDVKDILGFKMFLKQSVSHRDTTFNKHTASTLRANIADSYISLKDYKAALDILEEDIRISEWLGIKQNKYTFQRLADLKHKMGDNSSAISILKDLYHENLMMNYESEYELGELTIIYKDLGQRDSTAHYLRLSSDAEIKEYIANTSGMTEVERYNYWDFRGGSYMLDRLGYVCSSFSDGLSDVYYDMALRYKGFLLNYSNTIAQNILASGDKELIEAYNIYRDLKKKGDKESEYYERQCMHLYSLHPELYSHHTLPSWKDVQSKLKNKDIAIEFVRCLGKTQEENTYKALVLTSKASSPILIDLCGESELDKLVEQFQKKATTSMLSALYHLIWKPIEQYFNKKSEIYFSPHGALCQLNIESAIDESGLIMREKYNINRVSTTASINNGKGVSLDGSVLYGGLLYDSSSIDAIQTTGIQCDSLSQAGYQYLAGSLSEVKHIHSMIEQAGEHSELFTGETGTEASFKSLQAKEIPVIHLATHGFYYASAAAMQKNASELYLHIIDKEENPTVSENELPLMKRSGLIFSGATSAINNKEHQAEDDNVLFSDEISGLDLSQTKLLVLSACQTGLGKINGDGVYGLQRAFKLAGVETIIMSLWSVNDGATMMMMTSFYQQLLAGASKRDAFDYAIKKVRNYIDEKGDKIYESPYYWASFIMLD